MAPKLTPEERKKARAQKKLKVLEKKKQHNRDQLAREVEYGSLTLRKAEKSWRQMLINIMLPEMKKDLQFAWHNFERVIDYKDFKISLMMDELHQANMQYFLNLKTHAEGIDQLIQMFGDRIQELDTEYQNQVQELQDERTKSVENIKTNISEEENYLKTILYILTAELKEVNRTRRAEYFSKLEEQDSKENQLVETVRAILEKVHFKVWTDTAEFLDEHRNKIRERKKAHTDLKVQDDHLQTAIKKQLESIRKAYNTIRSLKIRKAEMEKFLGRRLSDLQSEYDFFTKAFNTLKSKLKQDTKVDFDKLSYLITNYHGMIEYFKALKAKGEHILHIGAMCRKLETLEEKILPFPVNFVSENSPNSLNNNSKYIHELDLFWQRVGKSDAIRYSINEEREFLITENNILKIRLHQYCECVKCPGYKQNKVGASMTITEGTHELKKYQKQQPSTSELQKNMSKVSIQTESDDIDSWGIWD